MDYHHPDSRWEIFGVKDFESYRQALVVKGLFHQNVLKDVSESFMLCEYMMAHAYYHYPLFDEALSKLLRIVEMAVKLRCKELQISLDSTKVNRRTGQPFKKNFSELINDLDNKEPAKKIKNALDRFRILRNSIMHPESHTYNGAMGRNAIMFGIVILNMIFLPDQLFLGMENEINRIRAIQSDFDKDLYVMIKGEQRILVENIEIVGAVRLDSGWQYLLVAKPVLDLPNPKEFTYPVSIITDVTDLQFNGRQLSMRIAETEELIQIEETNHPANIAKYKEFIQLKDLVNKADLLIYQQVEESEIGKRKSEFWYNSLWRVNDNMFL